MYVLGRRKASKIMRYSGQLALYSVWIPSEAVSGCGSSLSLSGGLVVAEDSLARTIL